MKLQARDTALVVGLGRSGMAAARFLTARGWRVLASEARPRQELDPAALAELDALGVELECGGHGRAFWERAGLIVPSPGVPLDIPLLREAARRGVSIQGELALAAPLLRGEVIAVTGTNGKTTVTSLVGHILGTCGREVFVGGNIGAPVLDHLMGPRRAPVMVLECSSFQLEISGGFRPGRAALLNLDQDHLERHGSMEAYARAKARIFANQGRNCLAVLGEDRALLPLVPAAPRVLFFGSSPRARARVRGTTVQWRMREFHLEGTALGHGPGPLNAAAALCMLEGMDLDPEQVEQALGTFRPRPHRMEMVAEIEGVRYINDSKATNMGAVRAALESIQEPVLLIAGGRGKGADFTALAPLVRHRVRRLFLLGEAAADLADSWGRTTPWEECQDMRQAVTRARDQARPGEVVLLSPACASFDMFRSYEERGSVFCDLVRELAGLPPEGDPAPGREP